MKSSIEMSRGNLDDPYRQKIIQVLGMLSERIESLLPAHGLSRGQVPFVRPSNFVAILTEKEIFQVVDNIAIGGIPDHTYIDYRGQGRSLTLEGAYALAIRELGFRNPVGVAISSAALESVLKVKLRPF